MNISKIALFASIFFLTLAFIFIPHTIELSATLDTWLPYKGLTIYKDFNSFHFPIGRFILIPVHLLSNWNLELDPFVGLAVGIANLFIIYQIGKKYFSETGTSIAIIFFSVFFWFFATGIIYFHELLISLLLSLSTLLLFQLNKNLKKENLFLVGLVLSLAEASGQIASFTVASGILIVLYILVKNKESLIRNFISFGLGLIFPFIVLVLYFYTKSALWEFIYWNTLYYFTYSTSISPISELPKREILAFYIPLIMLLIVFFYKLKNRLEISQNHLVITVLSISSLPFIIYSIFHLHHLNYPLGILAIAAGFSIDEIKNIKTGKGLIVIFTLVFLLLGIQTLFPWYIERLSHPSLKIANDVYPEDPMYDSIEWVKQSTDKSHTLIVVGDPLFYMRANRLPASRPIKSIIVSWEPIGEISREIKVTPPDYWIVDANTIKSLLEIYKKQDMVDFVNEELQSGYSKRVTFKNWEIWERN